MTDQVGYVGFELLDSCLVRKDAIKVPDRHRLNPSVREGEALLALPDPYRRYV